MRTLRISLRLVLLATVLFAVAAPAHAEDDPEELRYYRQTIRPIIGKHCFSCHNEADKKGGINLEAFDFIVAIVRRGELWTDVTRVIAQGDMPPDNRPRMSEEEKRIVIEGINRILDNALAEADPGQVVMRRLSNREYRYTILDLTGVDFDARRFFPADGSGGEGFDNQARVLYLSPLLLERYYDAAEAILDSAYADPQRRRQLVPTTYTPTWRDRLWVWWGRVVHGEDRSLVRPLEAARAVLYPFATRAYRRFPTREEKQQLLDFFARVYTELDGDASTTPDRFDRAVQETQKLTLVSPHFLYRREADLPLDTPYEISGFELASRLSYFLWSSMPDDELLDTAYRENLHDPAVLEPQVRRMLADPKSVRMAESFAAQWLDIDQLEDAHEVDAERFPTYSDALRQAMKDETVAFFHHVLTERRNFLDLLDSDYAFLNQPLAAHYGIEGVEGPAIRKVALDDRRRGGVLGMGSVLTATSLPTRTSPVLRGKWVLEQLLGTPPPPPPPDVPELEAAKAATDELDLRSLLTLHREPSACFGCHQRMDPLGLGLENFDAVGRWRTAYGDVPIDASGVLTTGEQFSGPAELKAVLLEKQDLFAQNLARKMLSFALGRGIRFEDRPTVKKLTDTLLEHDFATDRFITELVLSYPFRYKKSDRYEHEALQG